MKTVVIGLDSASWNLLMPWIKDGSLPTFGKLINEGVHGYLRSSDPPITFPAWKCYSTGKNPGKLGVYSFVGLDKEKKDLIYHTGADFKDKEIWDYLNSSANLNTCIINMPGTYPAKKTGIVISGGPILGDDYVFPEEIKKYLEQIEYKTDPDIYPGMENSKWEHEHLKKLIASRFHIANILKNKYDIDFFHITIFYIDKIQHSYFKNKPILKDYWKHIDKEIGNFLDGFNDDINLMLMSDHGATELKNTFYINEYLLEKGYLFLKPINNQMINIFQKNTEFILNKLKRNIYAQKAFKKTLPHVVKNRLIKAVQDGRKNELLGKIDWEKSNFICIGMGFGLIYRLNNDCDIIKIKSELENITDPLTGEQVAEIHLSRDVYTGNLNNAPDIIVTPKSNTMVTEVIRDNPKIWGDTPNDWDGLHEKEGLFLAHGPNIKIGEKIEGTKIYDLAPTILHMFGVPIPKDMDGRVLTEIFRDDLETMKRRVIHKNETTVKKVNKSIIVNRINKIKNDGKI